MVRKILNYNNEEDRQILSTPSTTVTDFNSEELKTLIQDLKDTMRLAPDARGISAIQIGVPLKVCICSWDNRLITMINPVFTRTRGSQKFAEGCLSVPGVYKKVTRFQKVWCSYLDENGEQQEIAQGGRMSDIIQHELDHFEGECKLYNE